MVSHNEVLLEEGEIWETLKQAAAKYSIHVDAERRVEKPHCMA
jgi:hypothetical protein